MMNFLKGKGRRVMIGVALAGTAGVLTAETASNFLWSSGNQQSDNSTPTKTWIWGNGLYRTGGPISFVNFEPKHIKTFNGAEAPHMR